MPLLNLIVVIVLVGVLLWLVNKFVPMDANVKSILNAVVIIALVLWILALFLPIGNINSIHVGHV